MYWQQCSPPWEVWQSNQWRMQFQICYFDWPGFVLRPGESRTEVVEIDRQGAYRFVLPVSVDAQSPQQEYRSAWWIVR